MRPGRLFGLWLAAALLAAPAGAEDAGEAVSVALSAKAVRLHPDDPGLTRVGRLAWRGGIEIHARAARFGGLSSLLVSSDGRRLLAVNDKGDWLTAALSYDAAGHLSGIAGGTMGRLGDPDGRTLVRSYLRDAEGLAALADGSVLLSFERRHRLWRYELHDGRPGGRAVPWPAPEGLGEARRNGGLEALTELPDGGLLALTEDLEAAGGTAGYLWRLGAWSPLAYRPGPGFRPTGAALAPGGGDVLVVERSASVLGGFQVRVVRLAADDVRPGAELRGEQLARWGAPMTVDNFEAVAARRAPDGRILIYLLSDDNFSLFQRTLLLMFELEG